MKEYIGFIQYTPLSGRAYFILPTIVQEVVFLKWIEMLIFGTNSNINLLDLIIKKCFGVIVSVAIKVHFEVI